MNKSKLLKDLIWVTKHLKDGEQGTPDQEVLREQYQKDHRGFMATFMKEKARHRDLQSEEEKKKWARRKEKAAQEVQQPKQALESPAEPMDNGTQKCVDLARDMIREYDLAKANGLV